jgi:hypothetical protein
LKEFVRSKTGSKNLLTKDDLNWIKEEIEEEVMVVRGMCDNFYTKNAQNEGRLAALERYCFNERPIISKVESSIANWKDFLHKEMTSIQNKLGADYELHWTKYGEIKTELLKLQQRENERAELIKTQDATV